MRIRHTIPALIVLALSACDAGSNTSSNPSSAVTKTAKGVEITLKEVEVGSNISMIGLVPSAPAGATYVHVTYALKNTSQEAMSIDKWPQPRLTDPAGHKFEPEMFSSTAMSAAANVSWAENLNPNLTTEAHLVWKVDEKSFDRSKWKLTFMSKPALKFDLK